MTLIAADKPGVPVSCANCQHQFPEDPPFQVSCPTCQAPPGSYCRRPSEHSGPLVPFHRDRDLKALQEGFYDHQGIKGCGPNSSSPKAKQIIYTWTHGSIQHSFAF